MKDNIIVYGATKERAINKLHQLLDDMRVGDIDNVRKSRYDLVFSLKNGDVYKAVGANDTARGHKWQYAYIDAAIDRRLVDIVILPSFMPKLVNGEYDGNTKIIDRATWY